MTGPRRDQRGRSNGGEIFARSLILLRTGMALTIDSGLDSLCWENEATGLTTPGNAIVVCNGGSLRLRSPDECPLTLCCGWKKRSISPRDWRPPGRRVCKGREWNSLVWRGTFASKHCGLERRRLEADDWPPLSSHWSWWDGFGSQLFPSLPLQWGWYRYPGYFCWWRVFSFWYFISIHIHYDVKHSSSPLQAPPTQPCFFGAALSIFLQWS